MEPSTARPSSSPPSEPSPAAAVSAEGGPTEANTTEGDQGVGGASGDRNVDAAGNQSVGGASNDAASNAGGGGAPASNTIADLIPNSAATHGPLAAARFKQDGAWNELTYAELSSIIDLTALGLIEIGLRPGERLCILANTRLEWSIADLAATQAGAVVVPIYQTNSPEECQWVIADSGATAIVCEDATQLAKIAAIRHNVPELRTIIVIDPPASQSQLDAIPLEEVRARGRGRPATVLAERRAAVQPSDPFTIIYTSGTTGPPKGCVLTHGNYRSILDMVESRGSLRSGEEEVVYLYLPLAHSFALLLQLVAFDLGVTLAYFGGDTKQIVTELSEVRPTYLPSVPRIFEKIYTFVSSNSDPAMIAAATKIGMEVRNLQLAGKPVPPELQAKFDEADTQLFANVRAAFGGRLREAVSGAAPIAKEILEFFFACGVPVMEGYGMTETATAATVSTPAEHRFGSVGKPLPGVQVKIAPDGELLLKGSNIFSGYYGHTDADFGAIVDGWLHTGDLGKIDDDGFVYIIGRKKDIIITAGGKNLTPANIENDMKQSRWISQAVMHGDRRPYPVLLITLDEEEIVPWAQAKGLPTDIPTLANHPEVESLIQSELDTVNSRYAQVEQVKRFAILDHDLSQETGELTPTLKVKRAVIADRYADLLDSLYQE